MAVFLSVVMAICWWLFYVLMVVNDRTMNTLAIMVVWCLFAGGLMAVGDVVAQFVVEKKSVDEYSGKRTGRFLVFGMFVLVSDCITSASTLFKYQNNKLNDNIDFYIMVITKFC